MIENDAKPAVEPTGEKKNDGGKKNKSVTGGSKNKGTAKDATVPVKEPAKASKKDSEKPAKKAGKKEVKKEAKAAKKEPAKKAVKAAKKEPVKKAVKKADKPEKTAKAAKPKAAAAKGQKIEGNPYRPGSAFFQVFERLRANPKKKLDLPSVFKGVDFPDQSRMLAHMQGHGETGERGVKFKLERLEGGFLMYSPR